MNKFILASIFAALSSSAFAINPYDFQIVQRNSTNTGPITVFCPIPASAGDGILVCNGLTSGPEIAALGHGLGFGSGQLIVTGLTAADVSGLSVIQKSRAQTNGTGDYTWSYPNAYGSGIVPIISVVPEGGSSVPLNVQIVGTPTNTSCTFKVLSLPSTSVLSIVVLGAPTGTQAYLHMTAIAP